MAFGGFPADAFCFYERLEAGNSRRFWDAHKSEYQRCVREPVAALAGELEAEFGPATIFRPHRHIRFRRTSRRTRPTKARSSSGLPEPGSTCRFPPRACWRAADFTATGRTRSSATARPWTPTARAGSSRASSPRCGETAWPSAAIAAPAGLLCSAVPMVADLLALRQVPAGFFGVFMSVNPVSAALTGLVLLGQSLGLASWLVVAAIVTANVVSLATAGRRAAPATA